MRLYNAAIKDRALTYAWFFLIYLIHIAFCVWAAVSPPLIYKNDWGHSGFITGIGAFDKSTFVGVVYMIGGGLWSLEALWSIWVLKTVRMPCSTDTPPGWACFAWGSHSCAAGVAVSRLVPRALRCPALHGRQQPRLPFSCREYSFVHQASSHKWNAVQSHGFAVTWPVTSWHLSRSDCPRLRSQLWQLHVRAGVLHLPWGRRRGAAEAGGCD